MIFISINITGTHCLSTYRAWPMIARDHTVLPATHSRTIPVFTAQLQSITALWLVLIAPTHRGMARLSIDLGAFTKPVDRID